MIFRRIDHTCNMARFYAVSIERTLWGTWSVICHYGRLGTFGQTRQKHFVTRGEAEVHRMRVAAAKMRRGYRPVSSRATSRAGTMD